MIITLIAAVDEKGGIGFKGGIPWHLPTDLARFKKLTMGHHLILGRKTFQSIGRPLPGRTMIVLSRDPEFNPPDCQRSGNLAEALDRARDQGETEVFVVGGGEIYAQALPDADRLYLTRLQASLEADTFFPHWDPQDWEEICVQEFPPEEGNPFGYTFSCWVRRRSAA